MQIIKVKFSNNGFPIGRAYTYYSKDNVEVGDLVQINSSSKGVVTEINVPEEEIASYKDKVKFIYGKVKTEPEEKIYNPVKANEAQTKYCHDNEYPHFAPKGKCWKCNKNIYESIDQGNGYFTGIDVEKASSELITGCPHCNRSYCD